LAVNKSTARAVVAEAENDAACFQRRVELCQTLAKVFRQTGDLLWIAGNILGPDRASKSSPFDFGNDAVVAVATITQIAGELTAGSVVLLEGENLYAAAALIRQLVEIEYLAWAFAEDQEQAQGWLRSTRPERMRFWQPRDLRRRSGGLFRSADYASHCERGGHPTPYALALLPDHSRRDSSTLWWLDLTIHAASTWDYLDAAATKLGWSEQVSSTAQPHSLAAMMAVWRENEPLLPLVKR
jgi:hypothetical protein